MRRSGTCSPLSRCISAFRERPPVQSGACDGAGPSCGLMRFLPKAAPSLSGQPERFPAAFRWQDAGRFRCGWTLGGGGKKQRLEGFSFFPFFLYLFRSSISAPQHLCALLLAWEALGRADHGGASRQGSVRVAAVVQGGEVSRSGLWAAEDLRCCSSRPSTSAPCRCGGET